MILDLIREKSVCPSFKISFNDNRFMVISSNQRLTPESSRRYATMLESNNMISNGNQNYNKKPFYTAYGISDLDEDLMPYMQKNYNTIENLFEDILKLNPISCEEFTE